MAKNRRFARGTQLTLPVIAGVVSGGPVIVGMIPGVALTSRDAAGNAVVETEGVFEVTVTGALTIGQPVYITSATGALVVAAGVGIQLFGHAITAKGAGAGLAQVRLAQYAVAVDTPA